MIGASNEEIDDAVLVPGEGPKSIAEDNTVNSIEFKCKWRLYLAIQDAANMLLTGLANLPSFACVQNDFLGIVAKRKVSLSFVASRFW